MRYYYNSFKLLIIFLVKKIFILIYIFFKGENKMKICILN